jgi:hypothetical protein
MKAYPLVGAGARGLWHRAVQPLPEWTRVVLGDIGCIGIGLAAVDVGAQLYFPDAMGDDRFLARPRPA